jgi:hypothetical protein
MSREEEIKQQSKTNTDKFGKTVGKTFYREKPLLSIPAPRYAITGISTLPPMAGQRTLTLHSSRLGIKDKSTPKLKTPAAQSLTSLEIRTLAGKELSMAKTTSQLKHMKGRLKPLKQQLVEIEDQMNHIELICNIKEGVIDNPNHHYYCKRGKNFYEFSLCQFEEIRADHDDYITVSSRGVTHFVGKEAEFLTFSDWLDEVNDYKRISVIPFFKNFAVGKCYVLWKNLVKSTKTFGCRSYLGKELFEADTNINAPLISIRKELYTLESSDITYVTVEFNLLDD